MFTERTFVNCTRRVFQRSPVLVALLCLAAMGGGCGEALPPGPERAHVSGKVLFEGKPVPFGTISFSPLDGVALPVSGAQIRDGQYDASQNGGVPVGKHRVEINGWASSPAQMGAADVSDGSKPLLPEKYNAKSELTISIDSKDPVTRDFDLK